MCRVYWTRFVGGNAQSALAKGVITVADIDARMSKLFKVRMRLGHFDPPGPLQKIMPNTTICSARQKNGNEKLRVWVRFLISLACLHVRPIGGACRMHRTCRYGAYAQTRKCAE